MIQKIVRSVSIDVIASGGVRNSEDLVCLEKAGATSVIVGTALYEGKISVGGKNAF
ncbi:MAG: HisA/HisF-related TIM barrel protein [Candidatus Micrarchaeia archaeon]